MELDGLSRYLAQERVLKLLKNGCRYTRNKPNFFIAFSIVDAKTIRIFNKRYRNMDTPTDVLSFGYAKTPKKVDEKIFLGEIMIAPAIARKQAKKQSHTLQYELEFLIVHGFLHLLGYDHETQKEARVMFRLQKMIAQSL